MDTLKLMIVDDEPIILQGLKETYPWEDMGYQVVGTYLSGEKALEHVPELSPNVILTDVRMKNINGIELMKRVKKIAPEVLFVVISAYRDFEYARSACAVGAFSYLLKPVDSEQLESIMKSVHEKASDELKKKVERQKLEEIIKNHSNGYRSFILDRYLRGIVSKENLVEVDHMIDETEKEHSNYMIVIVDLDITYRITQEMEFETKRFALFEDLKAEFSKLYDVWNFQLKEGMMVYLIDTSNGRKEESIRWILSEQKGKSDMEMIAAVSHERMGYDGLRESYEEAIKTFEVAREAGMGIVLAPAKSAKGEITQNSEKWVTQDAYYEMSENYILSAVRKNDLNLFKESYISYIYKIPSGNESYLYACIHRLALNVELLLYHTYGETENIKKSFVNFYQNFYQVSQTKAIDILYQLILQVIQERINSDETESNPLFKEYILQAKSYIEDHLGEEDLSISSVASNIYLNPVYFGRVFKNTVGMSFRQYVMNRRMELAKRYMNQGVYHVTDISSMVGISNSSYFTQLFKQYTGVLPSEYKGRGL